MSGKKLLIVDGHAVLHRAFHAMPALTNSKGDPVGAIYGFFSMVLKTIKDINPQKLVICFDYPAPNFRHERYVGYQIKRPKKDPTLSQQVKRTKKIVKEIGLSAYCKKGFEADDVIATVSYKAESKGYETVILTGDKDLMQLVDKDTSLIMPLRGISQTVKVRPNEVKKQLGIPPNLVIDYKALIGDTSDNYPGVPGIGPKTAQKLLKEFNSFDNIYKNLDKIQDSVKDKLVQGKEAGFLSQELAKVKRDVPVKIDLKKADWNNKTINAVAGFLKENGYPSLYKRMVKDFELKENDDKQMSIF